LRQKIRMERLKWIRLKIKMIKMFQKYIVLFFLLMGAYISNAQQEDIKIENVKVIKDFEARLKDFRKVKIDPILPSFDISQRSYDYRISSKVLKLEYEKPSIRPLALQDEKRDHFRKGHLKVGYGVPNAIIGEAGYGFFSDDMTTALSFKHESASNKNIEDQTYMNNQLRFNLVNDLGNDILLEGNTDLNIDYYNLYGVDANADTMNNWSSPSRRLLHWNSNWVMKKRELTESIHSVASLNYRFLHNNKEDASVHVLEPEIALHAEFGEDFSLHFPINAGIAISHPSKGKNLFSAVPTFRYSKPFFVMELGGTLAYSEDFTAFPHVYLGMNKLFNYFDLFAGVGEDLDLYTMYEKGTENPFFYFGSDVVEIVSKRSYYGGLRAHIEGAKFEFITGYHQLKNLPLFIPSTADLRQFELIYDDGTDFSLGGSLSYEITSNVMLAGKIAKHFYRMENEEKAWHKPDLEADFTTRITLLDRKLKIDASLFFKSGMNYPDTMMKSVDLPVIFDVSGAVEYELVKNFNLFAKWNNITATKYYRWYQYPGYRFHLTGGIKLLF